MAQTIPFLPLPYSKHDGDEYYTESQNISPKHLTEFSESNTYQHPNYSRFILSFAFTMIFKTLAASNSKSTLGLAEV